MLRSLRELYQYRSLLLALTSRELKARYRGSVLGFLWTFLNPTLLMLVYALVFGVIMPNDTPKYPYVLFVKLLPWLLFAASVGAGASTISDRRDLLTKVRFPAQVLPGSVVATNLSNYVLSLPLMLVLGLIFGVVPTWHALLFPLVLAVELVFTLALLFVVSALNVAFRDLQHIVSNFVTLWFFLTPILYMPDRVRLAVERRGLAGWVYELYLYGNPMTVIIRGYQSVFYDHEVPELGPLAGVMLLSIGLLWVATQIFEARREEFAELI